MQKANLPWLFILNVVLLIVLFISLSKPSSVKSALAGHIVISEVQISGETANDEFVELYNPTSSDMDLTGWRLARKTSGTSSANLVTNISGSIPAHGYFLVTPPTGYTGTTPADLVYSPAGTRISTDNTVYLYGSDSATLVDKVGIGDGATDGEGNPAPLPGSGQSIERKAKTSSTAETMASGDANQGNGEDTDSNSDDFILKTTSEPQDSTSSAEMIAASPSPSASESASPSTSPSIEPSESPSPSASASATSSPSISPSASPSASPSVQPSASPSMSPSASASASPSMSPSSSPSASPSPSPSGTPKFHKKLVCKLEIEVFKFGMWEIRFPNVSCSWKIN